MLIRTMIGSMRVDYVWGICDGDHIYLVDGQPIKMHDSERDLGLRGVNEKKGTSFGGVEEAGGYVI